MASLLFTEDAQAAFDFALKDAKARHNLYVDIENLLLGLLQPPTQEPLKGILAGVAMDQMLEQVSNTLGMVRDEPLPQIRGMTKELQSLMQDAAEQARQLGHPFINGGHLMLAMLNVGLESVRTALQPLNRETVRQYVAGNSPKPSTTMREVPLETVTERQQRKREQVQAQQGFSTSTYIVVGVVAISVYLALFQFDIFVSFWLVLGGWVLSVSVHEFAHALVAYWGGDYTVKDKGYLTFNPLKYTHPLLSIGLPLLFLAMGGLGLPGGAVYIERHRLRNKWWGSAVSLAGPVGTAIMAIIFAAPFWTGMVEFSYQLPSRLWSAVAFLAFLQVTAVFLNLLPIPPLDGFGIIEPFLSPQIAYQARSFGVIGIFVVFYLFRVSFFYEPFWENAFEITERLKVPYFFIQFGLDWFRFWVR